MVMDPRQDRLEEQFAQLERGIDEHLEDMFGQRLALHPSRMPRGSGSNPINDGLFSATIIFSMGYGTQYGRGYIVNIGVSTLDYVDPELKDQIMNEAFHFVSAHCTDYLPDRSIKVVRDQGMIKLIGDFSLR